MLAAMLACGPLLLADGTSPRPKPTDYSAQAHVADLTIAAEYQVRSFGAGRSVFVTEDYLVIEVALYSNARDPLVVSANRFQLRVSGSKHPLLAQTPGMVAASLKYPDWERRRVMEARGGVGDTEVIVGRPPVTGRFPGDPTPSQTRLPRPPQAPPQEDRSGAEPETAASPAEVAVEMALPEGSKQLPVAGYLYFPYKGSPRKIKTVDLLYQGPEGSAAVKLK
jgi:hypothetical protein